MIAYLNEDLLFLEFESLEVAKSALESGRRSFKGDLLQLEWWSPESRCIRRKVTMKEAWIRVVGLPLHLWTPEILHLWTPEILKKIGNACGGFLALDKETTLRTKVMWARILVKLVGKTRPSVVSFLEGFRSFELQIWWEIPPWLAEVYAVRGSFNSEAEKPEEKKDGGARATQRVGISNPRSNDAWQEGQECVSKKGKNQGHVVAEGFKSGSAEGAKSKVGIQWGRWGSEVAGPSSLGCGLAQQAESCGGSAGGINERINEPKQLGPKQLGLDRSLRIQMGSQQVGGGLQKYSE